MLSYENNWVLLSRTNAAQTWSPGRQSAAVLPTHTDAGKVWKLECNIRVGPRLLEPKYSHIAAQVVASSFFFLTINSNTDSKVHFFVVFVVASPCGICRVNLLEEKKAARHHPTGSDRHNLEGAAQTCQQKQGGESSQILISDIFYQFHNSLTDLLCNDHFASISAPVMLHFLWSAPGCWRLSRNRGEPNPSLESCKTCSPLR